MDASAKLVAAKSLAENTFIRPTREEAEAAVRTLIAWAGGREEVRAIAAALPLLARMKQVAIRTIGAHEDAHTEELIAYLGFHGIAAIAAQMQPNGKSVSETLLAEAKATGASLLVMGGYHHSRTREAVFGGTATRVYGI